MQSLGLTDYIYITLYIPMLQIDQPLIRKIQEGQVLWEVGWLREGALIFHFSFLLWHWEGEL